MFSNLIYFVGFVKLLSVLWFVLRWLRRHTWKAPQTLGQRYGEGSYAVVTGASAGMGGHFARQIAQQGLNLILIARRQDKMDIVKEDILKACPNCQVETFVQDFEGKHNLDYYKELVQKLDKFDISLVVTNAGVLNNGPFDLISDKLTQEMLDTNMYQMTVLAKLLVPKLQARSSEKNKDKRSGIIINSSCSALQVFIGLTVYSGTKRFMQIFADQLGKELINTNVDVQCLHPSGTATDIAGTIMLYWIGTPAYFVPQTALNDLGRSKVDINQHGTWWDEIVMYMFMDWFGSAFHPIFAFSYYNLLVWVAKNSWKNPLNIANPPANNGREQGKRLKQE